MRRHKKQIGIDKSLGMDKKRDKFQDYLTLAYFIGGAAAPFCVWPTALLLEGPKLRLASPKTKKKLVTFQFNSLEAE